MSVKDKFTREEWASLLRTPMLAAYAVAGSAPSKQEDFVREMAAVAEGVVEGEQGKLMQKMKADSLADLVRMAVRLRLAPTMNSWQEHKVADTGERAGGAHRLYQDFAGARCAPSPLRMYRGEKLEG
jgi:hypothetical protein